MSINALRSEFPPMIDFLDNEFYISISDETLSSVESKIHPGSISNALTKDPLGKMLSCSLVAPENFISKIIDKMQTGTPIDKLKADLYSASIGSLFDSHKIADHLKHVNDLLLNPTMHMLQPIIAKYSSASNIDPESNTDTACNQLVADEGDASADGTSDYQHILAASVDDPAQQSNLTPGSDLLIFASLWQSVISCPHEMCSDSTHKKDSFVCPKVAQEVILTNKNSLFEFKTQIYCYGNSIYEDAAKTIVDPESSLVPLNLPKDPNDTSGVKFTKLPSFFFIEDTFFIDYTCNDSSCSDPVSSIIAWLKNRQKMSDSKFYIPPGSPPQNLTVKDMSSICFENISFQLDKLYLFFHNGNCEHLFTFNELRLAFPLIF